MKLFILSVFCFSVFAGCATITRTGTARWYDQRMVEIEQAYESGEIDQVEYFALKNETDRIRAERRANVGFLKCEI